MADQGVVQILPADSTWMINIRTPRTSNAEATVQQALEQTVALLQGQVGVTDPAQKVVLSTEARILDRTERLTIPGLPEASRVYVQVPRGKDVPLVKGYTFFKPAPSQYVLFELMVPAPEFDRARALYEATIAGARFEDPAAVMANRGAAIKAGVGLFARLEPDDYVKAMRSGGGEGEGGGRWQRLSRPADTGSPMDAEELGYRVVKFWNGKRGEINPDQPRSRWKSTEEQDGYIAELSVRLLSGDRIIDTASRYFMTPDRAEEAWSIRMAQRSTDGKVLGQWTETGARLETDINILVQEHGKPAKPIVPFIQGEGYISQFETYLLPSLLLAGAIKDGLEGEFGFYTYRSDVELISIRRDTVARDLQAPGTWTIATTFRDEAAPQKAIYSENGELVRVELADGRRWEPVEPEQLMRLWKQKGLPTEPPRRP